MIEETSSVTKELILLAKLEKLGLDAESAQIELDAKRRLEANVLAGDDLARVYRWYGPVDTMHVADCVETTSRWSRRDPGEPITLTLNSQGGEVTSGFALYDHLQALRRSGHPVTTRASGMALSMGAILLQAGDVRQIDARAVVLIHELHAQATGRTSDMEVELQYIQKLQELALDVLSERATVTRATIKKNWRKGDWWLTAPEVLKYGLADEII